MDEVWFGVGLGITSQLGALLAYINPGTGSFILQVLMIGLAGAYVFFRRAGHQMKWLITRRKPAATPVEAPQEPREAEVTTSDASSS